MVRAFLPGELDELAGCLCAKPPPERVEACTEGQSAKPGGDAYQAKRAGAQREKGDASGRDALCACLEECAECECCGESWVLLGCVELNEEGITRIDQSRRRFVRPTECQCGGRQRPAPTNSGEPQGDEPDEDPGGHPTPQ
jgi:hypothetical protein